MSCTTYDPVGIVLIYKGKAITGFADGTFVTAARSNEDWSISVGADGVTNRVRSRDTSGTVEITLSQNGAGNEILSRFYNEEASLSADEQEDLQGGKGTGVLAIFDDAGNTVVSSDVAWIQKPADVEYGKDISDRTWMFLACDLTFKIGTAGDPAIPPGEDPSAP